MNVNDLVNGAPVIVNFPDGSMESAEYHGWTDDGIVVVACGSEHVVRWVAGEYVTYRGQTVTWPRVDDEVLPTTEAEAE